MTDFDLRTDRLRDTTVVVTGSRQTRPNLPSTACPFCVGGLEAPEPYDVRWFQNRWPAVPDGRSEVLLYSPDHDATLSSMGVRHATKIVSLWADRTAELGRRDDVAYVLAFENRGPEVGATIAHPHGQIYAFPEVPDAPGRELAGACHLCDLDVEDRLVARRGDWWSAVPEAAQWPFELLLAPRSHVADLVDGPPSTHSDLAALLVDALARLDQLFAAPMPYMLWVHQRPTDGGAWPAAHVHVHIAPLLRAPGTPRFVAAGELGSGVFFNPVVPEDAAERLRTLAGAPE